MHTAVIAVELDPTRNAMACHNAEVYGVRSRIEFVQADIIRWAIDRLASAARSADYLGAATTHHNDHPLLFDAVFMSPPWGGPVYLREQVFDLNSISFSTEVQGSLDAVHNGAAAHTSRDLWFGSFWHAVQLGSRLANGNMVLFLPRNTNMAQLVTLNQVINDQRHHQNRHCSPRQPTESNLEVEVNMINFKKKAISIYSGSLCSPVSFE